VQVELPDESSLQTWTFTEPMQEGTGDYPPRLEDQKVSERLVTWLRLRLPGRIQWRNPPARPQPDQRAAA